MRSQHDPAFSVGGGVLLEGAAVSPKECPHAHGEYADGYRHCVDCGTEWIYIGSAWFPVIGWLRMSKTFFHEMPPQRGTLGVIPETQTRSRVEH